MTPSISNRSLMGICSISLALAIAVACSPSAPTPKGLYTLDASAAPAVYEVDAASGTTERAYDLPPAKWMGVSASPAEPNVFYAVAEIVGGLHKVRIERIDRKTGSAKTVAEVSGDELGFGPEIGTGVSAIAMHPTKRHHGVLAVVTLPKYDPTNPEFDENDPLLGATHIVEVDFEAARATGTPIKVEQLLTSLTYDGTGNLYAAAGMGFTASTAQLYSVDLAAGELSLVGDFLGASQVVTGMVFDPEGNMLAIDGMQVDELVHVDSTTGEVTERTGKLGISTPKGLVYI